MTEFVRYALERGWWFYPASLKETDVAHSPRNGENVRALAFPLEDLYVNLLFCEYPVRDLERMGKGATFTVCGTPGGACRARLIPPEGATVTVDGKRVSAEAFEIRVGAKVKVR